VFRRNLSASFIKVGHLPWGWNQEYHLKSGTLLEDYVTSHSRRQQSSQSPRSEPKVHKLDIIFISIFEKCKRNWHGSFHSSRLYHTPSCLATSFSLFFSEWNHILHSHTMIHSTQISTWIGNSESTCKLHWKTRK
jgi:hypothetical protein